MCTISVLSLPTIGARSSRAWWKTPRPSSPSAASPTMATRRGRGAASGPRGLRIKGRIRQILRPTNQEPWGEVVADLNRVLRGWARYFAYGTRLMAYRAVDHYVWERTGRRSARSYGGLAA